MKTASVAVVLSIGLVVDPHPASAQDVLHGYYLRGDIGYAFARPADIRGKPIGHGADACTFYGATGACNGVLDEVGNSVTLGVGVGYRINPYVRVDARFDYAGWFRLDDHDQARPVPLSYRADLRAWSGLVNGYVDYPLTGWLTPYVGAGVGVARVTLDTISWRQPGSPFNDAGTQPGGSSTNFAWAGMAGVALGLTRNLKLDVGYRYLDTGALEVDPGIGRSTTGGGSFETPGACGALRSFPSGPARPTLRILREHPSCPSEPEVRLLHPFVA